MHTPPYTRSESVPRPGSRDEVEKREGGRERERERERERDEEEKSRRRP